MTFLFCDDDTIFLDTITELIKNELDKRNIQAKLLPFASGKELLENVEISEPDAIFLDIDMPDMTGFHVAEALEKMEVSPILIFVSCKDHLVFASFSYHPFWFLQKSNLAQASSMIEKLIAYVRSKKHVFHFEAERQHFSVFVKDIRYFENNNHYVTIYTTSTSHTFKAPIGEIEKELSAFYFVRAHVGYLVNCRYISTIGKNTLTLISGETIPIARNRRKELLIQFMMYTRSMNL